MELTLEVRDFLRKVITTKEGYFCLGIASQDGTRWLEQFFRWPNDLDLICETITKRYAEHNLYFSSYLFAAPQSIKANVLGSRTIQADLDNADIDSLSIQPTVLVESSPNRHQAYWILSEEVDLDLHELLSKKLTYSIPLCDLSGWWLGHKVRLPGTLNFKYSDGPKQIFVKKATDKEYDPTELELLPEVPPALVDAYDDSWIGSPPSAEHPSINNVGPRELLASIKSKIPPKVYSQYNTVAEGREGRSGALWCLTCAAFRAGLNRDQVYWLAKHSANNKFSELRYHGDRELCKDILRAEQVVRARVVDERSSILDARKLPGLMAEKRSHIYNLVLQYMKDSGDFVNTQFGTGWYIRRDIGRPIHISRRSEHLDSLLDLQFGLNATEIEQAYCAAALQAYVHNLDPSGDQSSLSFYNPTTRQLLLHTGRRDILCISPSGISTIANGSFGIVFPWQPRVQPFSPLRYTSTDISGEPDWADILFGDLSNIINMDPREARLLLKVWFMFLLFRNVAVSRPILAAFGQPGAGKSTLFRKLYALLYGGTKSVGSITTPEDFDTAVANDPFVVMDNVDTWEKWLPDKLALSAATSDIVKRKLYTDSDYVTVKRQAILGITAHNPKFGREDVADRLLLLSFQRLPRFTPEDEIVQAILLQRNKLWAQIVRDAQRVIAEPIPTTEEVPQFRVEDFARVGLWISRALGHGPEFVQIIDKLRGVQQSFSIEEEVLLVTAIRTYLTRIASNTNGHVSTATTPNGKVQFKSAAQWWTVLESASGDSSSFHRIYRNPVNLGKKLWSLQNTLKEIFNIEWRVSALNGTREWKITDK